MRDPPGQVVPLGTGIARRLIAIIALFPISPDRGTCRRVANGNMHIRQVREESF